MGIRQKRQQQKRQRRKPARQKRQRQRLGTAFGWLWSASVASSLGSSFALGAFPLIAIRVLHAAAVEVSALPAAGMAAGALLAVPLGPWVEKRHKRPVMIVMDLARFLVMASIPVAYAFGTLTFAQLLLAIRAKEPDPSTERRWEDQSKLRDLATG